MDPSKARPAPGDETLARCLRQGLDRDALAGLLADLARALHARHEAGEPHGAIDPETVRVAPDGKGPSLAASSEEGSADAGFRAPEFDAEALTSSMDVFSLGALLYFGLTGRAPVAGAATPNAPPPPPRALNPMVPSELEAICLRALSATPADRYPSAAAFAEALDAWRRAPRLAGPTEWWLPLLAALALGGFAGLVVLVSRNRTPDEGAPGSTSLRIPRGGDLEAPVVRLDDPEPPAVTSETYTLSGQTTDSGPWVEISVNGGPATRVSSGDRFRVDVPLTIGENRLIVSARDEAGNRAASRLTVTRNSDSADPQVSPPRFGDLPPASQAAAPLAEAKVAYAAGRLDQAEPLLREVTTREPSHTPAWNALGRVLLQLGRPKDALTAFTTAEERGYRSPDLWAYRSVARLRTGDAAGAIADADRALQADSSLPMPSAIRAEARLFLREPELALADVATHLAQAPSGRRPPWLRVGATILAARKALDPDAVPPTPEQSDLAQERNQRAVLLIAAADFENAIAQLDVALSHDPTFGEAYHNRGLAHMNLGQSLKAVDDFTRALTLAPAGDVYEARAAARSDLGDPLGAVCDLDEALRLDPTLVDAYYLRAAGLANTGRFHEALADFDVYVERDPANLNAKYERALLCLQLGDTGAGLKGLEEVLAGTEPGSPNHQALSAQIEALRR